MYTEIEYERLGNAAVIRLNRPEKLNALTYHTLSEIKAAIREATSDAGVIGIIITGKGRGFCAGLDSAVLAEVTQRANDSGPEAPTSAESKELPGIFSYLLEVPKPIIAAINGVAAGGGLILALMSDIRFAAASAAITTVFLKRGLIAEHGSSWILPRLVGTGRALDLLWASDKITAHEAKDYGLVERVVDDAQLEQEVIAYVEKLAVTSAPAAMAATKRLVYQHLGIDYVAALTEAEIVQNEFVASPDATEGAMALIEKRAPQFKRLGDA